MSVVPAAPVFASRWTDRLPDRFQKKSGELLVAAAAANRAAGAVAAVTANEP